MTMQNRCTTCPRPVPDVAYGCAHDSADLAQRLDQLAGILPEIETTITKQDRLGSGGPRAAGAEIPLPYRPEAADKARAIRGELTTWARVVMTGSGRELRGGSSPALARYLGSAVEWARYQPFWPEFHGALRPLFGSVMHLVDRPEEKTYLGPCNTQDPETGAWCMVDVLVKRGAGVGRCRACGAEHDAAKAKEWLLDLLADQLFLAPELSGILHRMGVEVGYSTLTKYARDKRFLPHAEDGRMRPLYRLGDVVDVVKQAEQERLRRQAQRHARGSEQAVA